VKEQGCWAVSQLEIPHLTVAAAGVFLGDAVTVAMRVAPAQTLRAKADALYAPSV